MRIELDLPEPAAERLHEVSSRWRLKTEQALAVLVVVGAEGLSVLGVEFGLAVAYPPNEEDT